MSSGTSTPIDITGENFSCKIRGWFVSPTRNDGTSAVPPQPNKDGSASVAMLEHINKDKDFMFAKICPPLYGPKGSLPRLTGLPGNEPDFIADFHFIAIMRGIDDVLRHRYRGTINGSYDTPRPPS